MDKQTFALRLTPEADDYLRSSRRYQGDMSDQIVAMLLSLNLETIDVQPFKFGQASRNASGEERPTAKTSIRLPRDLHATLKDVARRRSTSINAMINSVIVAVRRPL